MSDPLVTVLTPTYDHGPTVLRTVNSALRQTVEEIEIFVVGDGVPDQLRWLIAELEEMDERIRFFDYPKGPRHGEIHRHAALAHARGRYVLYLSDDDLWFPDHVETVVGLLEHADVAHTLPVLCEPDGTWATTIVDLSLPYFHDLLMNPGERRVPHIPLSCFGQTLDSYRHSAGWRTTPHDTYTDLYMWQQFLADPQIRFVSGGWPTTLKFSDNDPRRNGAPTEERCAELDRWVELIGDRGRSLTFRKQVLDSLARQSAWREANIADLHHVIDIEQHKHQMIRTSGTWRLRTWLVRRPLVGWLRRLVRGGAGRLPSSE